MRSGKKIAFVVGLWVVGIFAGGCHNPADSIASGVLCAPETEECGGSAELQRPGPGRNSMEIVIENRGGPATIGLRATTSEDVDLVTERPRDDDGALILMERTYPLGEGEVLFDALGSRELTVASTYRLEVSCVQGTCEATVEYLAMAESVECFDEGGCGRGETCEVGLGRCAECVDDSQCGVQQTCDRDRGVCFPGSAGCSASDPGGPLWPLVLGLFLIGWVLTRGEGRRWLPVLIVVMCLVPVEGSAEEGASLMIGAGPRSLTGEVGEHTRVGWGVSVEQQLRWRQVGASFALSNYLVPLRSDTRPAGTQMRGYGIRVGPRAYVPLGFTRLFLGDQRPLDLTVGVDYARWNVSENRLASLTGLGLSYNAVAPTAGLIWRWGGLKALARVSYAQVFQWPGGEVSADLMVGLGF